MFDRLQDMVLNFFDVGSKVSNPGDKYIFKDSIAILDIQ